MQSFISFNRTFGKKTVEEKIEKPLSGLGSLKTDDTKNEKSVLKNAELSSEGAKSVTVESNVKNSEISSTVVKTEETSSQKPINNDGTKKDATDANLKDEINDSESQEYIDIQNNAVVEVKEKVSGVAENVDHNPDVIEEMSEGVVTEDCDIDTFNLNKLKDLFEASSDFTKQCFIMYLHSSYSELLSTPVDDMTVDSETVIVSDVKTSEKEIGDKEKQVEDENNTVTDEVKSDSAESQITDIAETDSSNVDVDDISTSEVTDTDGNSLEKVEQVIDPDELTLKDVFCQTPVFERRAFLIGLIEQITELIEYLSNFNIKVDSKIEILDKKKGELFDRVEFSTEEDSIKLIMDIKSLLKKRRELEELKKTVDKVVETYR